MVEEHEPVREHQRLVVRKRVHAAAQPQVTGPLRGRGDEHLRRGNQLEPTRVVLTDPRLIESQPVEVHEQLEVAFDGHGRALPDIVERSEEDAEAHAGRLRARLPG